MSKTIEEFRNRPIKRFCKFCGKGKFQHPWDHKAGCELNKGPDGLVKLFQYGN
jgi:hypothetical protein